MVRIAVSAGYFISPPPLRQSRLCNILSLSAHANAPPETRRGVLGERDGAYSFTPPTAMPAMMYLLSAKYTMISGRAVMVRPR